MSSKDAKLQMMGAFIVELPEMAYASKTTSEVFKRMISTNVMKFRPPFAHADIKWPLRLIWYVSCNRFEVLHDPTGDVRLFPLWCEKRFNTKLLEEHRDQIWAEARERYLKHREDGTQWWLTDDEQEQASDYKKDFQDTGVYDSKVEAWLNQDAKGVTDKDGKPIKVKVRDCYFYREELEVFVLQSGSALIPVTTIDRHRERKAITDALVRAGCSKRQVYLYLDPKEPTASITDRPMLWRCGTHPGGNHHEDEVFRWLGKPG